MLSLSSKTEKMVTSGKKVSIIIPVYNSAATIERCLSGILEQNYKNFEVIVIDDGSTDNSAEIVSSFADVTLIKSSGNKGPSYARNIGIQKSNGEILLLIDSDSYVQDRSWIGRHVRVHNKFNDCLVGGGIQGVGKGIIAGAEKYFWVTNIPNSKGSRPFGINHFVTNNFSFSRRAFDKIGGFDETVRSGEDMLFCQAGLKAGYKLFLISDAIIFHQDRERLIDVIKKGLKYGEDRPLLKGKGAYNKYSFLLSTNPFLCFLFSPFVALLLTVRIIIGWWPWDKKVLIYSPLIFISYFFWVMGVVRVGLKFPSRKILLLFAVLFFASFYIFTYVFHYKGDSMAAGGSQEEIIFEYIAGKNFVIKGFTHLFFLQDYSTDFRKDSQPIFYTHNPPLPSIIQGLLFKIGLNNFQSRIIYTMVSLSGTIFLYLFIANIASISAAVFSSVLLTINFIGYLALTDHNHYALGFPLLFSYLWARNIQSPKKYFIVPVIFLVSSLTSYTFLPFIIILELLFFIFEKDKKLFFSSIVAALSGIFIHIIQNIIILTPAIAWQDIWLTIQNRIYGVPARYELLKFYQDHNLVLWGAEKLLVSKPIFNYIHSVLIPFNLFKTPLIIATVFAFIFCIKRRGNFYKSRRILIPAFLAVFIWHISIVQTIGTYPPIFHIFLVIFLGIILSDLLDILLRQDLMSFKNILIKSVVLLAFVLIIFKYFIWAGKVSNDEDLASLFRNLRKYQNKTFYTNIQPYLVSFGTQNWSIGSCEYEGLVNLDFTKCYSKFTGLSDEELVPDYILLSSRFFAFDCPSACFSKLKNDLSYRYKLVEDVNNGEDMIYQVTK